MKNLRIRPMGMVELEEPGYQKLYDPVTDLMYFLAMFAYKPEKRTEILKNLVRAADKIKAQLEKMQSEDNSEGLSV